MNLHRTIQNSTQFLSDSWKEQYGGFLQKEHLQVFSKNLEHYYQFGVPDKHPLPHFDEETTPPLSQAFNNFETLLNDQNTKVTDWAKTIETTPFEYLLILIGQRWTSATLKNEEAIPPLKETLLDSCFTPFNDQICIATRAWEKHIGRSTDNFWGEIKGNPTQKEEKVRKRILEIIENKTWWNIFYHYQHEYVYEIRVPSGHGIRWSSDGTKLIGFLEPFL
ncbi:hypothetical protein D1818_18495 [Aquimarina sp. BL5]|uniref:hypothetical protein n=1 Tax=Aquimarina sp. BL5 TaxID=1714860 RepID=UPI000E527843|nr:hypothetical protein [Aquimarina sp. BL5]AXT52716.1 hypothetical protein D1818_18495 [Aquimarina sp. BL5]RKN08301.1 hypothetical protein D7036_06105 [Aquimarina sp. BL5]